jgi:hypothetical protein
LLITLKHLQSAVGKVIAVLFTSMIVVAGLSLKDLVSDKTAAENSASPTQEHAEATAPPKPVAPATASPTPRPTVTATPTATAKPTPHRVSNSPESPKKRDAYWIRVVNNTKAAITFIFQNEDDTWSIADLQPRERELYSWNPGQERALHLEKNSLDLAFRENIWRPETTAFFSQSDVFNESEIPEYHFEITAERSICVCPVVDEPAQTPTPKSRSQVTSPAPEARFCAMVRNETGINLDIDVDENDEWKRVTVIPNHVGYCLGSNSKRIRFRNRLDWSGGWREFVGWVDGRPCTEWRQPSVTLRRNRSGKIFMEKP